VIKININSKYTTGLIIVLISTIGFTLLIPLNILDKLSFYYILELDYSYLDIALPFIILGIIVIIIGILFFVTLFSPERIKGYRAEYEVSPDLTKFEVVKLYSKPSEKEIIPEVAYCSVCGKKIYKPFQCAKCGQILCGTHYLPGSHKCTEDV
jgi:hypothetical protein